MSNELVPIDADLLNLLHKSFDGNGIPLPFVKEIFLLQCHIAGTSYRDNIADIEPELAQNDFLFFKRDTENRHDRLAIKIFDKQGQFLGYVPKERNEVVARLMDAGKLIFGKLESKQWHNEWLRIDIRVFMKDF